MKKNRIVNNAAWIIFCRVGQALLSLIIGMLSARYLGPSNYGLINYAASLVAFVAPVMYLGLNSILVQEIIVNPEEEGALLGTSVFLSFISSVVCIIGICSFVYAANPGQKDTFIVCVLYSIMLCFQAFDLLQYWFQSKLLSKYTSIVMLVAYAVVSAYKVFLLATHKSIYWFAVSNVIDYLVIAIGLLCIYRRMGNSKLSISLKKIPYLLSRSKYYIISNLMVMVFSQTDKIMLKVMLDDSATGLYSAAIACAGVSSFVFAAIIDSFRPAIFESHRISNELFEKNMTRLYAVIIWLSIAQSIIMTIFAKLMVFILYGNAYMDSVLLLRIVVWYSTFAYLGSVRGVWMLAEEKQKYLLNINIIGAVANIVLNYVLIPVFGAFGAAIASFVIQFFTNVLVVYFIKPLRQNNVLMVRGLNPKNIIEIFREIKKKNEI